MVGQIRLSYGNTKPAKDWIDLAAEIRAAKKELQDYQDIMTPYERSVITRSIDERKNQYFPAIYQGAADYLQGAIDNYKAAQRKVETEKMHEIARWDAGRLNAEMQSFQMRLEQAISSSNNGGPFSRGPSAAERIQNLYAEARASGDMYKQRAAAEVLQTVTGDNGRLKGDALVSARMLEREAQQELAALRAPESLREARRAEAEAAENAIATRDLVKDVGVILGEPMESIFSAGGFSNLVKRIQRDRETGELKFYELTDPEVTGVHWAKPPEQMMREAEEKESGLFDGTK